MIYTYDEILGRTIYTIVEEGTDVVAAVDLAAKFKNLNRTTREYLLCRLEILMNEDVDDSADQ